MSEKPSSTHGRYGAVKVKMPKNDKFTNCRAHKIVPH